MTLDEEGIPRHPPIGYATFGERAGATTDAYSDAYSDAGSSKTACAA